MFNLQKPCKFLGEKKKIASAGIRTPDYPVCSPITIPSTVLQVTGMRNDLNGYLANQIWG
jgi:hypothetical protein